MPGDHNGREIGGSSRCSKPSVRTAAGKIDDAELKAVERAACPGAGACGGQFTANTMAMVLSVMGLSAMGANDVPAVHPGKAAP